MFECPSEPAGPTRCIFKRYVCDGKQDCANGEDESAHSANCGKTCRWGSYLVVFHQIAY